MLSRIVLKQVSAMFAPVAAFGIRDFGHTSSNHAAMKNVRRFSFVESGMAMNDYWHLQVTVIGSGLMGAGIAQVSAHPRCAMRG
jgi:hypothetical protein